MCGGFSAGAANPAGPFYPPPLLVTFTETGVSNAIGLPGGMVWTYTNMALAATDAVFWGATNGGVKLSFVSSAYAAPGEVMSLTGVAGNTVIWNGQTFLSGYGYLNTRCRMVVDHPLVSAPSVGIFGSTGGVLPVTSPTLAWQATLYMEVFDSAGWVSGGNWVPAYTLYNASHLGTSGGANTSFAAGFWYTNQAPSISSPGNVTVPPGSDVGPLPFTVGDIETPAASLTVTRASDNTDIVPLALITVGGFGPSRTVNLHTAAGTNGVAHVTLTVTDSDGATNSQTFTVISDTAPSVSTIPDQLTQMGVAAGPTNFTVGDAETAANSLSVTGLTSNPLLVPATNIVFGGSDSNRTVTITPATGQFGTAQIGIQVSDGVLSTVSVFNLVVNSPPNLDANGLITLNQGATATITSSLLHATDNESSPTGIIFTVNPDGGGGPPREGLLRKGGTILTNGSTFTMADVTNNLITYQHNGSCTTNDDFQLGLTDDMGGVWSNEGHSVFSLQVQITPIDLAPVAVDLTTNLSLGGTYVGSLTASNADCHNTVLTYSITSPPTKGDLISFNSSSGQFTYVARAGESNLDVFQFQVSNGALTTVVPGTVSVTIGNTRPTAYPTNFTTLQGFAVSGALSAADPDLPAQALTFSLATQATNGTAVVNPNGLFTYTPSGSQLGIDAFTFTVSDGQTNSTPAAVTISIVKPGPPLAQAGTYSTLQETAVAGTLQGSDTNTPSLPISFSIVTNASRGTVALTNTATGGFLYTPAPGRFGTDSFEFAVSNGSTGTVGAVTISIQPRGANFGEVLLSEQALSSIRLLNPTNGDIAVLSSTGLLASVVFLASEQSGKVLVVDQNNGLLRIDPASGTQTVVVPHSQFGFPVGVAVEPSGNILVSDVGAGIRRFASDGTLLTTFPAGAIVAPAGIAVAPDGQIYVVDAGFFVSKADSNKVVQIDPVTLSQTTISTTGLLQTPVGVAVETNGNLLVAQPMINTLTRIVVPGGAQSNLASGDTLNECYGVAATADGRIFVANASGSSVTQVDPVSGAQTNVSTGGSPGRPFGIAIAGQPILPPKITSFGFGLQGQAQIHFQGYPGGGYSVRMSTNAGMPLIDWSALGAPAEVAPGQYLVQDPDATNSALRVYRAQAP